MKNEQHTARVILCGGAILPVRCMVRIKKGVVRQDGVGSSDAYPKPTVAQPHRRLRCHLPFRNPCIRWHFAGEDRSLKLERGKGRTLGLLWQIPTDLVGSEFDDEGAFDKILRPDRLEDRVAGTRV